MILSTCTAVIGTFITIIPVWSETLLDLAQYKNVPIGLLLDNIFIIIVSTANELVSTI